MKYWQVFLFVIFLFSFSVHTSFSSSIQSNVNVKTSINSNSSSNTTTAKCHNKIKIEVNGKTQEYESENCEDISVTSNNDKTSINEVNISVSPTITSKLEQIPTISKQKIEVVKGISINKEREKIEKESFFTLYKYLIFSILKNLF